MDGRRGITGPPLDQPDGMIVNETEHHHMKIRSVGIDLGKTTFHLVALGERVCEKSTGMPLSRMRSTFVCGTPIDSIMSFTEAGSSKLYANETRRREGGRKSFSSV
jgi:hypothetical protein